MNLRRLKRDNAWVCRFKLRFSTPEAAQERINTLRSRGNVKKPEDLNVYKCLCGEDHYHVGHRGGWKMPEELKG